MYKIVILLFFISFNNHAQIDEVLQEIYPVFPICELIPDSKQNQCFDESMFEHVEKKFKYPKLSTNVPEQPPINLGKNNIKEVNRAYWDVVKFIFVRELRKATKATEAIPAEILSAIIIIIKYIDLGSNITNKANKRFVVAANTAPSSKIK